MVRYARTAHDPDWFAEYAKYETQARVIRFYRLSLIPGLFQTPEYARACITASRMVTDIEGAVEARMRRQDVLRRDDPPHVWVLLDESALLRPIGGPKVMRDQLAVIHELACHPQVSVRVVPQATNFYLGLDGSFNRLALARGSLAFVEAPGGGG
ncbi:DUF5753 domain-containing protein [Actinomadura yumaensis]|uniref:DUF5753 domain-containing protein n=1 Tax=Actinomadura yumaensis TaxID=111807 RepID=UPI00361082B7